MPEFEELELGTAQTSWGGFEVLSAQGHCRVTRRVRDGALFAEIWVPRQETQELQYIGPVRLPSWQI